MKPNIWGLIFQNLPNDKSPNDMKWRIFQLINAVKELARGFPTGGEPISLKFALLKS